MLLVFVISKNNGYRYTNVFTRLLALGIQGKAENLPSISMGRIQALERILGRHHVLAFAQKFLKDPFCSKKYESYSEYIEYYIVCLSIYTM